MARHRLVIGLCAAATLLLPDAACAQSPRDSSFTLARAVLKELVEINTGPSGGLMSRATAAMAERLLAAGYPRADVQLAGPDSAHRNLIATLRGRDAGAKPIVLMAHIDVVEALSSDWSMDPFVLHEQDGYFYGRGVTDNKGGAALLVANMIRFKREKFVPARDVILILTTDEETSAQSGIVWLLAHVPALRTAEYALNTDAGGLEEQPRKPPRFLLQSSEKMYQTYQFEVTNRGGHSSLPRDDNAIYTLARGLERLERYRFPVQYNAVTRESFARSATLEHGELAADFSALARGETSGASVDRLSKDASINGNLRTTCVATMLGGGHAENALPQRATATVNCRIFPGVTAAAVQATLVGVVADTAIHISTVGESTPSDASPLRPDVVGVVESQARRSWPGAVTIPVMENGATDGLFLRNIGVPVFGISGPLYDLADDRAHGRDERLGVAHFSGALEFWYRVVKELMGSAPRM
ncbi:MAG: M20/M25/M40 family metallo-hydrolase [Gemmatimonadota bacterium]